MRCWLNGRTIALSLASTLFASAALAAEPVPPPGFQLLFNGRDLTHWETPETRPQAAKHWRVVDAALEYSGKWRSLRTTRDYENFELWVDWKIPPRGDSGIYLRGKPQVQIWDRPKLGSGGIFNNKKHPRHPLVVADAPPGQWNTFKMRIVDDNVTVRLNDKLVVDNTTMECYPHYKTKLPAKGKIELQHHGSKLWFRNIFIKPLPATGKAP